MDFLDPGKIQTSALSDGRQLLLVAQDVGRHNTIDRLWGKALKQGVITRDRILLASGRISSEMLNKAAKMGVPVVISRTSPTSLSVELGRAWNITLIGYARGNTFRIYTIPDRVVMGESPAIKNGSGNGQLAQPGLALANTVLTG